MSFAIMILNLCLILLIVGLAAVVLIWVLGMIGVSIPPRVIQILGAIVFVMVLIWFLGAISGKGHFPTILALGVSIG